MEWEMDALECEGVRYYERFYEEEVEDGGADGDEGSGTFIRAWFAG